MKRYSNLAKKELFVCLSLIFCALTEVAKGEQIQMLNNEGKPIENLYVALKSNSNLSGKIISPDTRVLHIKNPILVRMAGRTFLTGDFLRYFDRSGRGEVKEVSRVWFDFFEINVFTENEIDLETGQLTAAAAESPSNNE